MLEAKGSWDSRVRWLDESREERLDARCIAPFCYVFLDFPCTSADHQNQLYAACLLLNEVPGNERMTAFFARRVVSLFSIMLIIIKFSVAQK